MRRFSLLLVFALVGICFGAEQKPASTFQGKEPTYEDKTLSKWTELAKGKDVMLRRAAVVAFIGIGPAAVPAVTELLKHDDVEVRRTAALTLTQIVPRDMAAVSALTESLQDKDWQVRRVRCFGSGEDWPRRQDRRSHPHAVAQR